MDWKKLIFSILGMFFSTAAEAQVEKEKEKKNSLDNTGKNEVE